MADDNVVIKRESEPIYNHVEYAKRLSKSINNYQQLFGIFVDVYRIIKREDDPSVVAFGPELVTHKSMEKLGFLKQTKLLVSPSALYYKYGSGADGVIQVHCSDEDLLVGDILRYRWADGDVLEFVVVELPKTYGNAYYQYTIKGYFAVEGESNG